MADLYIEGKKENSRNSTKFCSDLFSSLYKSEILDKLERKEFVQSRDLTKAWESLLNEYISKVTKRTWKF